MTNTNIITVDVRNVYGNTMYYPMCDTAKTFAKLANTTTLTPQAVRLIKSLGYTVQVQTTIPTTL